MVSLCPWSRFHQLQLCTWGAIFGADMRDPAVSSQNSCPIYQKSCPNKRNMASKAALVVLALAAGTAAAADPINTDKYTAIAEAGACRGNGGSSDKVNSKYKLGLTQAECETECDSISTCLGYAYQTGASDVASAYCLIHGPGLAGTCSDAALDTQEKCEAKGTCSIASVACADSGTYCLGVEEACTNLGGTWTKSATTVWTATSDNGWEGDSHPTCLLYTSPSPRDQRGSRMPSSA